MPHIFDPNSKVPNTPENINNLQNSDSNTSDDMKNTGGTELKQEQTNQMINTINVSQSRLNALEEKENQ